MTDNPAIRRYEFHTIDGQRRTIDAETLDAAYAEFSAERDHPRLSRVIDVYTGQEVVLRTNLRAIDEGYLEGGDA